ncbi:hypothetical protein PHYPSEUDO_015608 [Phytophthora pseudosyringae]|uniref:Uncharacterized protein n=1 Tax=Phytophthora pseudosyringae TaxID=221518 RepID=A0A8T1W1T4_9STRA|nr:hypothetical protein PHYPSEUDO_015608 [Phytophthora pseudosyringae]
MFPTDPAAAESSDVAMLAEFVNSADAPLGSAESTNILDSADLQSDTTMLAKTSASASTFSDSAESMNEPKNDANLDRGTAPNEVDRVLVDGPEIYDAALDDDPEEDFRLRYAVAMAAEAQTTDATSEEEAAPAEFDAIRFKTLHIHT